MAGKIVISELEPDSTYDSGISLSANTSTDALRITQTGTGNALVVEDSANPDSSPFVIGAGGNVGIGTSSPSTKLELSANDSVAVRLKSTDTGMTANDVIGSIEFFGSDASSAGAGVKSSILATAQGTGGAASDLRFYTSPGATNNEQRMVIDSEGRVLIGTDSGDPFNAESLLRIQAPTGLRAFIQLKSDNDQETNILFGDVDDDVRGAIEYSHVDDSMRFTTNDNNERMRITSAGEVLVGGTTEIQSSSGALTIQQGNATPYLNLWRNDNSIVSGDAFGVINFLGRDTTGAAPTIHAGIEAFASGTHSPGDNPTDLRFYVTADNTETIFEALRIKNNGTLDSQDTYDNTQTGSTVVVTSAGLIGRTSSSIKYKKDVETLNAELVDNAIANLRPVWYRTKDAKGDDKETWSHIGLIAEEVHEVEPRLVRYRTENVEFVDVEEEVTKTREVSPAVTDEEGNVVQEAVTEEYTETVTRKEKQKTLLETPEPEDVDYGRLAVLCLAKIQQQEQTIAALEARISALESGA